MPFSNPLVSFFLTSRLTPDDVMKQLREAKFSEESIQNAYIEFKKFAGSRKYLSPPPMLVNADKKDDVWYPGADNMPDFKILAIFKRLLTAHKKMAKRSCSIDT